jgi:hypothetical protein
MSPRTSLPRVGAIALGAVVLACAWTSVAWAAPAAPTGVTPFAQDGRVVLAWQAVESASSYRVYRGVSPGAITQQVSGSVSSTTYTDATTTNGTTYYYRVVATNWLTGSSPPSLPVSATPRARSCSTGSPVVLENCFPGGQGWKSGDFEPTAYGGIEGYLTRSSVAAGETVQMRVNAPNGVPYRVEVWRTGWYGGDQGRLIGTLTGRTGTGQPACTQDYSLGLIDCGAWSNSADLTTSSSWPTGVYLLKLVREDNALVNHMLLTVRETGRTAPVLFDVPTSTYQAYNGYGGRALYTWNSSGQPTVSGQKRAVKVSYDRPYEQSVTKQHDFFTQSDIQLSSWLERQGYDLAYVDSVDVNAGRANLSQRTAVVLASHDEYQSPQMRSALTAARNAGVSIASFGANALFWSARFEASPSSGVAERTLVSYKTTESGPADPSGVPTSTWRDPLGANQPENALMGGMYIGQNTGSSYPLYVTSAQGKHRIWRYAGLSALAPGTSAQISYHLVGWEWDARVANGQAPAGVEAVASSPVSGDLLQDAGRVYAPGSAVSEATLYRTAGGATVFSAGTNNWSLGLGYNVDGRGEPDPIIHQATANLLADMRVQPATASGITADASGRVAITSRTPAAGATGVATGSAIRFTVDRPLDPSTVRDDQVVVTGPGGVQVPGAVSYDDATRTVRFTPASSLSALSTFTVQVGTAIAGWNGLGLASPSSWTFTTASGVPPAVTSRTPAPGATNVNFGTTVRAVFDAALDPATVTTQTVRLSAAGGDVASHVSYDSATRTVTLTPDASLSPATQYTMRLTTGVKGGDGTPLAAEQTWSFTTFEALAVTARYPAPLATGISTRADVRVTFGAAADPSTLTPSSFTLTGPSGAVSGSVSYDAAARTATLHPAAPLTPGASYTAAVETSVRGADGAPLAGRVTWTFSTALTAPPAPAVTVLAPAGGATDVAVNATVRATFDRSLDPASLTAATFTLRTPGGATVAAAIQYDDATRIATLIPNAPLGSAVTYTARLTTGVRSSVGEPLASDVAWSFTTAGCPCSTMPTLAPAITGIAVRDGRPGAGPFSRELGVKLTVDQTVKLTALRFYKSPGETGVHIGRLWTAGGGQIATATFGSETASGWQSQNLADPVTLRPGRTYIASININNYYVVTRDQLATSLSQGPLRTVADGANGVFSEQAGELPTDSWRTSNYFVDVEVAGGSGVARTPAVTSVAPIDGATGIGPSPSVTATFSVALDPATVNAGTFTLRPTGGGSPVAATVTYSESAQRATLTPSAPLDAGTSYTATLSTAIAADDGTPLGSPYTWRFTTLDSSSLAVTATSPADAATDITTTTDVRATFSQALDASTLTSGSFTLKDPGGSTVATAIAYNTTTHTAVLTPAAPLQPSTVYAATLTTAVRGAGGSAMASNYTWHFTTSACPCMLMANLTPNATWKPVQDGRSGAGPFSYEMGTEIRVSQPAALTAIRFYKSPSGETGTHVGRVWTMDGTQIAQVTFTGETGSGWQQQALASPIALTPGTTYVVSVNMNNYYVVTLSGLASSLTSGPVSTVANGANGVYAGVAGAFPSETWSSSNYFIDAVVR